MKSNQPQTPTAPRSRRQCRRTQATLVTPDEADQWWDQLVPAEKSAIAWLIQSLQRADEIEAKVECREFRKFEKGFLRFARTFTRPAPRAATRLTRIPQTSNLN